MSDSTIVYISVVITLGGGLFNVVIALYYSVWKCGHRNKQLSQAEFYRASKLVGVSAAIMAIGIVIMLLIPLWQDPQLGAAVITIFVSLLCLAGFPLIQVGWFVWLMKRNRFVKPPESSLV